MLEQKQKTLDYEHTLLLRHGFDRALNTHDFVVHAFGVAFSYEEKEGLPWGPIFLLFISFLEVQPQHGSSAHFCRSHFLAGT